MDSSPIFPFQFTNYFKMKKLILLLLVFPIFLNSQDNINELRAILQHDLDSIIMSENRPGATLAAVLPNGQLISLAAGFADVEENTPMPIGGQMFTGSTGKTFFSAAALQLVEAGKFSLDDKVSMFFEEEEWFKQLPNATDLTIRSLMNHTSGLPRYIFQESFLAEIKRKPMRGFTPEERLSFVFGMTAAHEVGKGWGYSDTNYILLGMVMEKAAGKMVYELVQERILDPFLLRNTYPSTQRELPGLTQGYIGENNFFDLPKKTIEKGKYVMNPQFEWTGGGFVTNVEDMAFWMKWLHEGQILLSEIYNELISPVDFKNGQKAADGYGLGTFVWETDLGIFYGHAGIMPGHLTQIEYSKENKYAIAFQVNTDEGLGRSHHGHVQHFAKRLNGYLSKKRMADENAILANFLKQTECWNRGDIDCYMEGYYPSEDIRTIGRSGQTRGYEEIKQRYKKGYPPEKMGQLHFDEMSLTRFSDEHYYVVGRYNLTYENGNEPMRGWFSVIMKKIEGKWWIVSDHSS